MDERALLEKERGAQREEGKKKKSSDLIGRDIAGRGGKPGG